MPRVKRYVIFRCYSYYPEGGWGDMVADFDTVREVQLYLLFKSERSRYVWWGIVDLETGKRYSVDDTNVLSLTEFFETEEG